MKWRRIPSTITDATQLTLRNNGYLMSEDGLVRPATKVALLIPQWRRYPTYYISGTKGQFTKQAISVTKQAISVTKLFELTFHREAPNFNHIWYQNALAYITQQNAKAGGKSQHGPKPQAKSAPDSLDPPPRRKCTTCGKPTNNYRCNTCWKLLRKTFEPSDEPGDEFGDPTECYTVHWR